MRSESLIISATHTTKRSTEYFFRRERLWTQKTVFWVAMNVFDKGLVRLGIRINHRLVGRCHTRLKMFERFRNRIYSIDISRSKAHKTIGKSILIKTVCRFDATIFRKNVTGANQCPFYTIYRKIGINWLWK